VGFLIHPSLVTMFIVACIVGFSIEAVASKRRKARKVSGSGEEGN